MATGSGAKRAAKDREVSLRKETEVQCGIVRLLYEDGSLSEKEYEDIVECLLPFSPSPPAFRSEKWEILWQYRLHCSKL